MKKTLIASSLSLLFVSSIASADTLEERLTKLENELIKTKAELAKTKAEIAKTNSEVIKTKSKLASKSKITSQPEVVSKSEVTNVTETTDMPEVASKPESPTNIPKVLGGFEFKGYTRAGFFADQDGYKANYRIEAPGAPAKYRLGNESSFYSEAELVKKFSLGGAEGSFHYTIAFGMENLSSWADVDIATRELYSELTPSGGPTYWAGKRFYAREDIHTNDYYYKDFSGTGAGIKGIKAGSGTLDLALITTEPLKDVVDEKDPKKNIRYSPEYTLHAKYFINSFVVEGAAHYLKNGDKTYVNEKGKNEGASWGVQGAFNYNFSGFYGMNSNGSSKVVFQAGYGLGAGNGLGRSDVGGKGEREDAFSASVFTFGQSNLNDSLQIMPVLGYKYDKNHEVKDSSKHWVTAGLRIATPITQHFAMQYDAGVDYVHTSSKAIDSKSESLGAWKITIAPTMKLDTSDFWGRPELRAFVTYGRGFGDNKKIRVDDKGEAKKSGFIFGLQTEVWF